MSLAGGRNPLAGAAAVSILERMTADPVTVKTSDSCLWALRVMSAANVHHLPVLEGDRVVGILTEGDVYRRAPIRHSPGGIGGAGPEALLSHVSVAGVMSYAPVTIEPSQSVAAAVELMIAREVGSLLVVDDDRLVGILTVRDALRLFLDVVRPLHDDGGDTEPRTR